MNATTLEYGEREKSGKFMQFSGTLKPNEREKKTLKHFIRPKLIRLTTLS